MSAEAITGLLIGPVAGLAIALAVIYMLLYTRKLVPGYIAQDADKRSEKLDAENERLNSTILELSTIRATMEERVKSLEGHIEQLEDRTRELTEEVHALRGQLGDG